MNEPKLKSLLNNQERTTHALLEAVCARYEARVFAKIRVADVLPVEGSGISNTHFGFSLRAHFDFVVTDFSISPLFCVEFDGPLHATSKQRQRDQTKNELCKRFGMPLLRINSKYINRHYRDMDLLSWFIHSWFLLDAFNDAQLKGYVPEDEVFDPGSFVSVSGTDGLFPLSLAWDVRREIWKLADSKMLWDMAPSCIVSWDEGRDVYRAQAWIRIERNAGVLAETAMHSQSFPVIESDLLSDLVIFDLWEVIQDTLAGKLAPVSSKAMDQRIKEFDSRYSMRQLHCAAGRD